MNGEDGQPGSPLSPAFQVRAMLVEDIAAVIELAAGEPTAPHWPMFEYRRMLNVIADAPGRRAAWVLEGSDHAGIPGIYGFAMASHVAGICDLEAVVVTAVWRGRRLGGLLVETAVAWGQEVGASRLELEVRASNEPALRLYRRLGFKVDGTRPGYYRSPEEEAVLMGLELRSGARETGSD